MKKREHKLIIDAVRQMEFKTVKIYSRFRHALSITDFSTGLEFCEDTAEFYGTLRALKYLSAEL